VIVFPYAYLINRQSGFEKLNVILDFGLRFGSSAIIGGVNFVKVLLNLSVAFFDMSGHFFDLQT
jgi:hypothetical protein